MIPEFEEGGPPLTTNQVAETMQWFDFDRVHRCMVALNWQWASLNRPTAVPTINEIKDTALQLLQRLGPACDYIYTGGFEVQRNNGVVMLRFIVADWEMADWTDTEPPTQQIGAPTQLINTARRLQL